MRGSSAFPKAPHSAPATTLGLPHTRQHQTWGRVCVKGKTPAPRMSHRQSWVGVEGARGERARVGREHTLRWQSRTNDPARRTMRVPALRAAQTIPPAAHNASPGPQHIPLVSSFLFFYLLHHPSTCESDAGHTCAPLILCRIVANLK